MKRNRWETILVALTVVGTVCAAFFGAPPVGVQWTALAAGMVLAGLPHGAVDDQRFGGVSARSRLRFQLGYFACVLAVIVFWVLLPVVGLLGFLAISAWHFGNTARLDRVPARPARPAPVAALAKGIALLAAPCLGSPEVCAKVFSSLTLGSAEIAGSFVHLFALSALGLATALFVVHVGLERSVIRALAGDAPMLVAQWTWLFVCPPILGFGVWFAVWHSLPEIREQSEGRMRDFYRLAAPNTALTILGAGMVVGALAWSGGALDDALFRVTFIGLAAVTVPHMWVNARQEPRPLFRWELA